MKETLDTVNYAATRSIGGHAAVGTTAVEREITLVTNVSWDPGLFINQNPVYFDIDKWTKQEFPVCSRFKFRRK